MAQSEATAAPLAQRARPTLRRDPALRRLGLSALLIVVAWGLRLAGDGADAAALHTAAMTAAALISGSAVARRALVGLRLRAPGIETLVTVAAAGALAIGEHWEAAAVTFLFDLGGYLEGRTLEKARAAIQALAAAAPQTARIRRAAAGPGQEVEVVVPADAVKKGDRMVIRAGERIAADGIVSRGQAEVDEAALTGELLPKAKGPGDPVLAGSVVTLGMLEAVATRTGQESTFARIARMVGEAEAARSPVQTAVERFARYYTPAILALAAATWALSRDTHLALTLLVVACPGALVLAAPVSLMAGIGRAARQGILFKGGQRLEQLARVQAVAFDKTGTLTEGRPEVVRVWAAPGWSPATVLQVAASAERASTHPLALAIVEHAKQRGLPVGAVDVPPESVRIVPGRGLAAEVEGRRVLVGSRAMLEQHGVVIAPAVEREVAFEAAKGRSVAMVAIDGQAAGLIALADRLRPSARGLVTRLRQVGVRHTVILTGDTSEAAEAVAREVGIDEALAGLLPEAKVEHLAALRRRGWVTAMVGDGINDAPALSAADVSIAIGVGGTEVAMEAADLALVTDDLGRLPVAIGLARAIVANVRQNLALAVAVVVALVAGVMVGSVHLASGMMVHELSVLAVILNGMRLLRWQEPHGGARRAPQPPTPGGSSTQISGLAGRASAETVT
ncbi:heavy metal translocating P-type ATPase [Geochorda subterranea]|uniref:Cd(2+)-exporting ATPase n=1 Tax=Geochorda subterranea TaxID=3109564 RepID=A0ABZ1BQ30_9FIRM|nr:cation-translocating P-type ATPase [Limnochorda sp. LNt]WRP14921.1 cation-translocating P-type ATPase [Limnochorda sp. LNt]